MRPEAQAKVADTVHLVDVSLPSSAERASEQTKSDDLKKLAEELKQSSERLRAETHSDEAQKAALRELSALEARDGRRCSASLSPPEEMKRTGRRRSPLRRGWRTCSMRSIKISSPMPPRRWKRRRKRPGKKSDAATDEQVQQALKQATERLALQHELSDALQKLADQARQQGAGQKGMTAQAMEQLRKMLQQMQGKEWRRFRSERRAMRSSK